MNVGKNTKVLPQHFNPHTLRIRSALIIKCSENDQVVCTTHSQLVIYNDDLESITLIHK